MTAKTDAAKAAEVISRRWRAEHRMLSLFVEDFQKWAYEVAQRGLPSFGQTSERLQEMRQRLVEHFDREQELSDEFTAARGCQTPAVETNRRQVDIDHANLLTQLDAVIEKLEELDPPFDSWQKAIEQVERFVDQLNRHEEEESDCITWMLSMRG